MISTRFIAAIPILVIAGVMAYAAPPKPSTVRVLSANDRAIYQRAYEAAEKGDWVGARALAGMGANPLPRQLLEWRYALQGNATFEEIDAVLKSTAGWPGRALLVSRAEQAILPETDPSGIIAWFGTRAPSTSIGRIRLGDALITQGGASATRGRTLVRDGWVGGSFDTATELAIVQEHGAIFTPADERTRLDNLIWRSQITAARRQLARVSGNTSVARARIALAGGTRAARMALAETEGSSDAGLLYDWAVALRREDQEDAAHAMLLRIPAGALKDHAANWWNEHHVQARDALTDGDPRMAIRLLEHAALAGGADYSEQQFLIGFINLRSLKEARTSLPHFQRMEAAVGRPVSKAKAQYWQGRAYDALGDGANAMAQYRRAAAYPETFYGQLALARTGGVVRLTEAAIETAPESELETSLFMPAIKVLAELGQASELRLFVDADLAAHPGSRRMKRMMQSLSQWGYPEIAVRLAKALGYEGSLVLAYSHPVLGLPAFSGAGTPPPPALVLGLIRQESEFDTYAVSGAGAQGIMQIMPATARAQAKIAGLPFRPDALVGDAEYSIKLGMSEFSEMLARYNGSVILAVSAYNAGPGNASRWIRTIGDPRVPGVDPIDWIERIPFGETRNYVARVLENAGVYRARLAGGSAPSTILNDLYAPNPPATQ
ncbi:MAG TPA: transglycosylase SLT domain-containing protein [Rhizomicrobium sp.]|nr:transglycosylase SLT domain-containing protein [Rhizomicrobium sp.]